MGAWKFSRRLGEREFQAMTMAWINDGKWKILGISRAMFLKHMTMNDLRERTRRGGFICFSLVFFFFSFYSHFNLNWISLWHLLENFAQYLFMEQRMTKEMLRKMMPVFKTSIRWVTCWSGIQSHTEMINIPGKWALVLIVFINRKSPVVAVRRLGDCGRVLGQEYVTFQVT